MTIINSVSIILASGLSQPAMLPVMIDAQVQSRPAILVEQPQPLGPVVTDSQQNIILEASDGFVSLPLVFPDSVQQAGQDEQQGSTQDPANRPPIRIPADPEIMAPEAILCDDTTTTPDMPEQGQEEASRPGYDGQVQPCQLSGESINPGDPVTPCNGGDDCVIVVTGGLKSPADPMAEVNLKAYEMAQNFDAALVEPIARGYEAVVPKPVRSGIRNFLNNLFAPVTFLNDLLQLKPGKALKTLGRFVINTTLGIGGVLDIAKRRPFNLPRQRNGFANTLGYYGVKPGPYLFLPLIGPTTLRDLIGGGLDGLVMPLAVGGPFRKYEYTIPAVVLREFNNRLENDELLRQLNEESGNPYIATREFYLRRRQAEIDVLRGIDTPMPDPLNPRGEQGPDTQMQTPASDSPAQTETGEDPAADEPAQNEAAQPDAAVQEPAPGGSDRDGQDDQARASETGGFIPLDYALAA